MPSFIILLQNAAFILFGGLNPPTSSDVLHLDHVSTIVSMEVLCYSLSCSLFLEFLRNSFHLIPVITMNCRKFITCDFLCGPWAYGVVVSMFDFHRSDRGSNPCHGSKIS